MDNRSTVVKSKDLLCVIPGGNINTLEAKEARCDFVENELGIQIPHIKNSKLTPGDINNNIEKFIGSVEVPLGLAGPLYFTGQHAKGQFFVPLATTEGALVASMNRGCKAISMCGGVNTATIHSVMTRAPMFEFESVTQAVAFESWVRDHFAQILEIAESMSSVAKVRYIKKTVESKRVHLMFIYETGDAAGQNMVTKCTYYAMHWIMTEIKKELPDIKIVKYYVEGNLGGDKNTTFTNFINGRGTRVIAEANISEKVLQEVLKVDSAEECIKTFNRSIAASAQAGMIGHNLNVPNTLTAIFIACGQDVACVHESGVSQLHMELTDNGIYISLTLPSLVVGTVGGGTNLPGQRECLNIMGSKGKGKKLQFAEQCAGFALALELSILSAMHMDHFAEAHERLGRNHE